MRDPRKERMGTLNISFVAIRGPPPQSFDKPTGEADRGRGCSSPNPVAMSRILRGLQTRRGEKLPSFRCKTRFSERRTKQILEKWTRWGPRKDRKTCIALTGQIGWAVFPMIKVWPERNGSVLDTLILTDICWGLREFGRNVISHGDKWMAGEKGELHVISPRRRKPKKARVMAAHNMIVIAGGVRDS